MYLSRDSVVFGNLCRSLSRSSILFFFPDNVIQDGQLLIRNSAKLIPRVCQMLSFELKHKFVCPCEHFGCWTWISAHVMIHPTALSPNLDAEHALGNAELD